MTIKHHEQQVTQETTDVKDGTHPWGRSPSQWVLPSLDVVPDVVPDPKDVAVGLEEVQLTSSLSKEA